MVYRAGHVLRIQPLQVIVPRAGHVVLVFIRRFPPGSRQVLVQDIQRPFAYVHRPKRVRRAEHRA